MYILMVIITSLVILLTVYFKRIVRLHSQIEGRWLSFLPVFFKLAWRKRKHPKGRLDLHNLFKDALEDIATIPFKEAIVDALPKKDKPEDLYIHGFNSTDKSRLRIQLKRRPIASDENCKDKVSLDFSLEDGKGNTYWLKEETIVDFNEHEYKASGFAFEVLLANKTARIKFRGYMHKNEDTTQLHYVRIRLLVLSYSRTYDHLRVFDPAFLAQEIMDHGNVSGVCNMFEDRIEQYCHIKGLLQLEGETIDDDQLDNELHFLAYVGRRYLPRRQAASKRFIRLSGVNKEGITFQLGLIQMGATSFRFGQLSARGQKFLSLTFASLKKEELKSLKAKKTETIKFTASFGDGEQSLEFQVKLAPDSCYWTGAIDGVEASGMLEDVEYDEIDNSSQRTPNSQPQLSKPLVVAFEDDLACKGELTGGKGASLAQLCKLSKSSEGQNKFQVPDGLVVTSSAYNVQTLSMPNFFTQLQALEKIAYVKKLDRNALEDKCIQFSKWFAGHELEKTIEAKLEEGLRSKFGGDFEKIKFSVRSSAAFEDSAEMSAAGQMTTFLGVRGLKSLAEAVVKCWSSQFEFVPIEYKRGYGQEFNSPMAVVVQKMVACQAAGVAFTANPIDGDERVLTITSNFGLGESVVSASADPDTFQLNVKIDDNRMQSERRVTGILSKTIGKKKIRTIMHEDDDKEGVKDEEATEGEETRASLGDEQVVELANLALLVHRFYGNARDIEWGYKEGTWYMLQSRPITNLDSTFTSYELMHECDTAHMTETEVYSRNHWGENFPGSSSWIANTFFHNNLLFARGNIMKTTNSEDSYGPFRPVMGYITNQLFFNFKCGGFTEMFADYPESYVARSIVLAFFGRDLTDPEVIASFQMHRKQKSWREKLFFFYMLFDMLFRAPTSLKRAKQMTFEEHKSEVAGFLKHIPLHDQLDFSIITFMDRFMINKSHGSISFGSSIKNMMLHMMLKSSNDDKEAVSRDYNLLLSQCNDVVSAEVPNMLREVALAIEHRSLFASMSDEEALAYLQTRRSKASELFELFLLKHGHRGFREMDPYNLPWGDDPTPCIQVIKSIVAGLDSYRPKERKTPEQLMDEIETTLSGWRRYFVAKVLLPACHNSVGYRENSKSVMVKLNDSMRKAFWLIAHNMVEAGYLPEVELFFFLKVDEAIRLIKGERNPILLMKAKQRRKIHPKINDFKYEEFVKGFRMRPRNLQAMPVSISEGAMSLRGTAVTIGSIKARICVAETIGEAKNIEQGDILVTYSTDIGWSPYFPLISGIVTEIGGTISHGSVIAREFGIPCLIAVEGACVAFQTGDIGYLDTKTGTLTKVDE